MKNIKQIFMVLSFLLSFFSYCVAMETCDDASKIDMSDQDFNDNIKNDFNEKNQDKLKDWLFLKYYFKCLMPELQYNIIKNYALSLLENGEIRLRQKLKGLSLISKEFAGYVETLSIDSELAKNRYWQRLLEAEEYVRANPNLAEQGLINAYMLNDVDRIYFLLLGNVNPNAIDYKDIGRTTLMNAARDGNVQIVKMLLYDTSADVDLRDSGDRTALVLCAMSVGKYAEIYDTRDELNNVIVEMLLDKKAALNTQTGVGNTALMFAAEIGYNRVVQSLLNAKAEVDLKNNDGDTALIKATRKGHIEIVKLLLNYNADVNTMNSEGETALTCAERGNYQAIKELLLANGACKVNSWCILS